MPCKTKCSIPSTNLFILISLLPLLCQISYSKETSPTPSAPVMVIGVYRHGIRTPTSADFDPYWADMLGELTPHGMRQTYILGRAIALQYPHLFSVYRPNSIYIRSTSLNRTLLSAQSHLNGIYGAGAGPILNKTDPKDLNLPYNFSSDLLDQLGDAALPHRFLMPPIHTVDLHEDYLLYAFSPKVCPAAKLFKKAQVESKVYKDFQKQMSPTLDSVRKVTGQNLSFDDLSTIYSTLNINFHVNKSSPEPFDKVEVGSQLWKNLTFIHNYQEFFKDFGTQQQVQLFSFALLKEILRFFQSYIDGNKKLQYVLFSSSDTLLMPLLHGLGIASHSCLYDNFFNKTNNKTCTYPEFASNLIFELYENSTDFYIQVKYNDKVVELCVEGAHCSYSEFQNLVLDVVDNMTLEKFTDICSISTVLFEHNDQEDFWALMTNVLTCILGILILGLAYALFGMNNKKNKISQTGNLIEYCTTTADYKLFDNMKPWDETWK